MWLISVENNIILIQTRNKRIDAFQQSMKVDSAGNNMLSNFALY